VKLWNLVAVLSDLYQLEIPTPFPEETRCTIENKRRGIGDYAEESEGRLLSTRREDGVRWQMTTPGV
jgi:hypothetical protein